MGKFYNAQICLITVCCTAKIFYQLVCVYVVLSFSDSSLLKHTKYMVNLFKRDPELIN